MISACIEDGSDEEAFFLIDLGELERNVTKFTTALPTLSPYYSTQIVIVFTPIILGVKCNADLGILQTLNSFGCGFKCRNFDEIKVLLDLRVPPESK